MAIVIAAVLFLGAGYFMRLWSCLVNRMTHGRMKWIETRMQMTDNQKAIILFIALLLILLARVPGTM